MGSLEPVKPDYDVLVIGGGLSGCYACHRMKELNLSVKVLEAGTSVGGTWYWNRYPGARFDSESYTYAFYFSPELLDEWKWTEHYAPQAETERYIRFLCDRLKLWDHLQFNTYIDSAHWLDQDRVWTLTDKSGKTYNSRFLITGIGVLSNPTLPNVPGVADFKGEAYHTSRWPKTPVDFTGKRVGVIGTGATAIQAIPVIAETAAQVTVFQRTANWAIPLRNAKISDDEMEKIRSGYPEMLIRINETRMGFMHSACGDSIWDYTPEEREVFWEKLWALPGFPFWLSNYKEIMVDEKANDLVTAFAAKKTKERVHDPWTADKLIPKNHGFGTRRVPMETYYFEAYNRPTVRLVDLLETPFERVTEDGIITTAEEFKFDILVYATGFDAVTGAFDAIDFRGTNDHSLRDEWKDGPRTYLGLTVEHFPNMWMSMGPHQAYGNIPRSIEYAVGWIAECIEYCRDHDISYFEATAAGVQDWTDHVHDLGKDLLSNKVDSWMTGVNKNVAGKQKRIVARYMGSAPEFREKCKEVANTDYSTFTKM
ncbi:hypothetical protein B0A48_04099 [Cryoendolithus antarcticus]|uniref:FAD/NAD(P)-binding domain-containing protein n=1 Tax=Cryoendolithus antarcticus TaxID=1507870 RepID=A0A1V8THD6_9PEZI|nr:hypothetical protein B0A48_04099 [Cryoendolithus antarcticus]